MSLHTKAEYVEVAPYVMGIGDFSADAIETKLAAMPQPPAPPAIPEPTKAKIVALFNTLFTNNYSIEKAVENLGGIDALATSHGMTPSQCRRCVQDFLAIISLYKSE